MSQIPWTEESVFESYDITQRTFKTIGSHEIKTAILVPKGLRPGNHPVIYNLHGGFLMNAHGLLATFYPKWVDKLSLQNDAIVISPDYRLLPSKNGVVDLLEDLEDGWEWTKATLPGLMNEIAPGHTLDFSRVLLTGGSAGGYCITQLAMSYTSDFKAVAMVYPFLDQKDKLFMQGCGPDEPTPLRYELKDIPSKEDTLAWIHEQRKEIHSQLDLSDTRFSVGATYHGLFYSHIFDHNHLMKREFNVLERLEDGARLPPRVWVMHGTEDSTVAIRTSDRFTSLVKSKLPEIELRYDVVPGEDHGFEFDEKRWASFEPDVLAFVKQGWLI